MNNIFLPPQQDPILSQYTNYQTPQSVYPPQLPPLPQYPQSNTPSSFPERNWIDELDMELKNLPQDVVVELGKNEEWMKLNTEMSAIIHNELMTLIRNRLINSTEVHSNARKQLEIIHNIESTLKAEEKRNMSELNDYVKNYSHLTFDEYRKIKESQHEN